MTNIKALTEQHTANRNPAAALGRFLLDLSNSPEFLVANLRAYLRAAEQDQLQAVDQRDRAIDAMLLDDE